MASAGLYASVHLIPDNHANIPPLSLLQVGCPSCRPNNSIKALKANQSQIYITAYQKFKQSKVLQCKWSMAVCSAASPLRELTCHTGSHSVTCHPAEVTFLPISQLTNGSTWLNNPGGMQGPLQVLQWKWVRVRVSFTTEEVQSSRPS